MAGAGGAQAQLSAQQAARDSAAALKSAVELERQTAEAERVAEERAKVLDVLSADRSDEIRHLKADLKASLPPPPLPPHLPAGEAGARAGPGLRLADRIRPRRRVWSQFFAAPTTAPSLTGPMVTSLAPHVSEHSGGI